MRSFRVHFAFPDSVWEKLGVYNACIHHFPKTYQQCVLWEREKAVSNLTDAQLYL